MWKLLLGIRHVSIIGVISSFVGSFLMFYVGAYKTFIGVWDYFGGIRPDLAPAHMTAEDIAIGRMILALDSFLVALILMYFGYAIYALFIANAGEAEKTDIPRWLIPSGIGELKEVLAQVLIVILFVLAVRVLWLSLDNLTWELLVVPITIVLLALALRIVGFKEGHKEENPKVE